MRIHLFKKTQDPASEAPAHTISRALALKICASISIKHIAGNAIQLQTNEPFAEIKARLNGSQVRSKKAIRLPIRDWRECLLITYPAPDQRSNPAF